MSNVSRRTAIGAFKCKACGSVYTRIVSSMMTERGYRRTRKCLKCNKGFVTYEVEAVKEPT